MPLDGSPIDAGIIRAPIASKSYLFLPSTSSFLERKYAKITLAGYRVD